MKNHHSTFEILNHLIHHDDDSDGLDRHQLNGHIGHERIHLHHVKYEGSITSFGCSSN